MQFIFVPLPYMQVKHLKATTKMNNLLDVFHFCNLGEI